MIALSIRLPKDLHKKLVAEAKRKPHLSLNAVIVETLLRELENEKAKKAG